MNPNQQPEAATSGRIHRFSVRTQAAQRRIRSHFRRAHFESLESRRVLAGEMSVGFSTYLGSTGNDVGANIATDAQGNSYIVGTAAEVPFFGQGDSGINVRQRAYLSKFDPRGAHLFTKLLGNTQDDPDLASVSVGTAVAVNAQQQILVAYDWSLLVTDGHTVHTPLTDPYESHVALLSSDGEDILFDTVVLKGGLPSTLREIVASPDGTWFVAGDAFTGPGDPLTVEPLDGFLAHVANDGQVDQSLRVGGNHFDSVTGLALSVDGSLYLQLQTDSDYLPTAENAFQTEATRPHPLDAADFRLDAYIARFTAETLDFWTATYLGGVDTDSPSALAVGPTGIVFSVGYTGATDFPREKAWQAQLNPDVRVKEANRPLAMDGYITALNADLSGLVASTYFGGVGYDEISDVAIDALGNVYVAGQTDASDLPMLNAAQPQFREAAPIRVIPGSDEDPVYHVGIPRDFFVAKFDSQLTDLLQSTYYGGMGYERQARVAVDALGTLHLAGTTSSEDYPTVAAAQSQFAGGIRFDNFSDTILATDAVAWTLHQSDRVLGMGGMALNGQRYSGPTAEVLAARPELDTGNLSSNIDWGDGATSAGGVVNNVGSGTGVVLGDHIYQLPGAYPVRTDLTDQASGGNNAVSQFNITPLSASQTSPRLFSDGSGRLVTVIANGQLIDPAMSHRGLLIATSLDRGATWQLRELGAGRDALVEAGGEGDVIVDHWGNLHVAYLSADRTRLFLASSIDFGQTFTPDHVVAVGDTLSEGNGVTFDGPSLALSPNGDVWLSIHTSNDKAFFYSARVTSSGIQSVQERFGVANAITPTVASGPDNQVAFAWQEFVTDAVNTTHGVLRYSIDHDGSGPEERSTSADLVQSVSSGAWTITSMPRTPVTMSPMLACDRSGGPSRGTLYVTYVDLNPAGGSEDLNLFVRSRSVLDGTWSGPDVVADDADHAAQFLPGIDVDDSTGAIAIAWYDTRDGISGSDISYYVATKDGGVGGFSPGTRVSAKVSNSLRDPDVAAGRAQLLGVAPRPIIEDERLYAIWSDNSAVTSEARASNQFDVVISVLGVVTVQPSQVTVLPLPVSGQQGVAIQGSVGTFVHPNPGRLPSEFRAWVNWGDGTPAAEATTTGGTSTDGMHSEFIISASHTYVDAGAYPVEIEVDDLRYPRTSYSVTNITQSSQTQTEGSLAVSPGTNSDSLAVGLDTTLATMENAIFLSRSTDRGASWTTIPLKSGRDGFAQSVGPAVTAFDSFGNLLIAYATASPAPGVSLIMSVDSGRTLVPVTTLATNSVPLQVTLAVGPGLRGTESSLWMTWREEADVASSKLMLATAPIHALGSIGNFLPISIVATGADGRPIGSADLAVGPSGEVTVAFQKLPGDSESRSEILIRQDPDGQGPAPFQAAQLISGTNLDRLLLASQPERSIDASVRVAIDRSQGPYRGRVYLLYLDTPEPGSDDSDLNLRSSAQWSEVTTVTPSSVGAQFLPGIAVDDTSGDLAVSWYDTDINPDQTNADDSQVLFRFAIMDGIDGTVRPGVTPELLAPSDIATLSGDAALRGYGSATQILLSNGMLQSLWSSNSVGVEDAPHLDLIQGRWAIANIRAAPIELSGDEIAVREGTPIEQAVATFEYAGADADWFSATLNWGDGTDPEEATVEAIAPGSFQIIGSHSYRKHRDYSLLVSVRGGHTQGQLSIPVQIEDAPRNLILDEPRVIYDREFTEVLGYFFDLNHLGAAADFHVKVSWGDGTESAAELAPANDPGEDLEQARIYAVRGTHTYAEERDYDLRVVVEEDGSDPLAEVGMIHSVDPPLQLQLANDFESLQDLNTGELVLATFTVDGDIDQAPGEYTAEINWGDGSPPQDVEPIVTSAAIAVRGSHVYSQGGIGHVTVTVRNDSGGEKNAPVTAKVKANVSQLVHATGAGLIFNPADQHYYGEIDLQNTSFATLDGPLTVVISELSPGLTLVNAADRTTAGDARFELATVGILPGATLSGNPLVFSLESQAPIQYTTQVYAYSNQEFGFGGLRTSSERSGGFEPNLGQGIGRYLTRGNGYVAFFDEQGAVLGLLDHDRNESASIRMRWVGGDSAVDLVGDNAMPGSSNYLRGNDPADWITDVPRFERVRANNVYAGIDLDYYENQGALEYDWIVAPGVDPRQIRIRFEGATAVRQERSGALRIFVGQQQLVQHAPVAYQTIDGERLEVAIRYQQSKQGDWEFALGKYDVTHTLIIDPVLIFSTFFGGTSASGAEDVVTDAEGNSYVIGTTASLDLPSSISSFQAASVDQSRFTLSANPSDAYVAKFSPSGQLIYSTYLSGNGPDFGLAIDVDATGAAYAVGATQSTTFPTRRAVQSQPYGGPYPWGDILADPDIFVTKLAPDGKTVDFSTYLGGAQADIAYDVRVDSTGAAVVVGSTRSIQFPVVQAIQSRHSGFDPAPGASQFTTQSDAFVTRLSRTGDSLDFSTFLGGNGNDELTKVLYDADGNLLVAGSTLSTTGLPLTQALQTTLNGGLEAAEAGRADLLLSRIQARNHLLDRLTYWGGDGNDRARGLALDRTGKIFVLAETTSSDIHVDPLPEFSRQTGADALVARFNALLTHVERSRYLGGTADDMPGSLAIDADSLLYVVGQTKSSDLPQYGGWQDSLRGESDGFVAVINGDDLTSEFTTYLGGSGPDALHGVAAAPAGRLALVGDTFSTDFPLLDAYDPAGILRYRSVIANVSLELPANVPVITTEFLGTTAVEGTEFRGPVAIVTCLTDVAASDLNTSIDWGDGTPPSSASLTEVVSAVPGRRRFHIDGQHTYERTGVYDVAVNSIDAAGNRASSRRADRVIGRDHVTYRVRLDTSALKDQDAFVALQFNAGAAVNGPGGVARVVHWSMDAVASWNAPQLLEGHVTGDLEQGLKFQDLGNLNRWLRSMRLGSWLEFDVELRGTAITSPDNRRFTDRLAIQLLGDDGVTPLLSIDGSGAAATVSIESNGTTKAETYLASQEDARSIASVTALGALPVRNASISVTQTPIVAVEGSHFAAEVATFVNANPFESVEAFSASIDWGDGTPISTGVVSAVGAELFSVQGSHQYEERGRYTVRVTVRDRDGGVSVGETKAVLSGIEAGLALPVASSSSVAAFGDLNRDGQIDIVLSTNLGVNILLGSSSGHFGEPTFIATGFNVSSVAVADANNDGLLDLAVANAGNNSVSLLLGNGNGTFRANFYRVGFSSPGTVAMGDVDHDGRLDLVTSDLSNAFVSGSSIRVAFGNGDGTFRAPSASFVANGTSRLELADFNGDHRPDVLVATAFADQVSIQLADNTGRFGTPMDITPAGMAQIRGATAADLDLDGDLDVVIVSTSRLAILRNDGASQFLLKDSWVIAANYSVVHVATGDMNGDGFPEIVASRTSVNGELGGLVLLTNQSQNQTLAFSNPFLLTGVGSATGAVVRDVDGDHRSDLLVSKSDGATLLLGNDDSTFSAAVRLPANAEFVDLKLADFNRDGWLDTAFVGGASLHIRLATDGSGIQFGSLLSIPLGVVPESLSIADLNGDQLWDVVTTNRASDSVTAVLGHGDGTFGQPQSILIPRSPYFAGSQSAPSAVRIADVTGDGHVDLVVGIVGFAGAILRGTGTGSFAAPTYFPLVTSDFSEVHGSSTFSIDVGDLNHDGLPDIVSRDGGFGTVFSNRGTINVHLASAAGDYGLPISLPAGAGQTMVAVTDVDGDSWSDIIGFSDGVVTSDFNARASVIVYRGQGRQDAPFDGGTVYPLTGHYGASSLQVADLDGDGYPDVVVNSARGDSGSSLVTVTLRNRGDGTLDAPTSYDPGVTALRGLATGDLNRDGRDDIVSGATDQWSILFSRSAVAGATVLNAPIQITGQTFHPPAAQPFTAVVASFTDANLRAEADDFSATVWWGDGTSSDGEIERRADGGFDLVAGHTYAQIGDYLTQFALRETGFSTHMANGLAVVGDDGLPPQTRSVDPFQVTEREEFLATVAAFHVTSQAATIADFNSIIDWADGTKSRGTIQRSGSEFLVLGRHVYQSAESVIVETVISDLHGNVARSRSNVHIAEKNQAPAAVADQYDVGEDAILTVDAPGILANDKDADGDTVTIEILTHPMHGALQLSSDGGFRYEPEHRYVGSDSFTYRITDGASFSRAVAVTLLVFATPSPWRNSQNALDVNASGFIEPIDAILIINRLNHQGAVPLPYPVVVPPYYDVSGDRAVTPEDAILVIQHLNHRPLPGEAEYAAQTIRQGPIAATNATSATYSPMAADLVLTGPADWRDANVVERIDELLDDLLKGRVATRRIR